MAWRSLIVRFFRLGPLGLGVCAVALLVAGYFLQVWLNQTDVARSAAFAAGAPAAVTIETFDPTAHVTVLGETTLTAQPMLQHAYRLTGDADSGAQNVYAVPLIASDGADRTEILGVAYFRSSTEDFPVLRAELLTSGMVGFGSIGPVVSYNGAVRGMGQWAYKTAEAFARGGLTLPARPVVIWPYMNGRAAAYDPPAVPPFTVFGILSKIAGILGIIALAKIAFRTDRSATPTPQAADVDADDPTVASEKQTRVVDDTYSDLDYDPDPDPYPDPMDEVASYDDTADTPRRRFGVRKALIGLVGGAFAVLLAATVYDIVTRTDGTAAGPVATVQTPQDIMASTVADRIVPDADPNRHWTDIDVTPVVEWFVAKGALAATGDKDALVILGTLFGGLIFALFMLKFYFTMRRTVRLRTTARIDAMGL